MATWRITPFTTRLTLLKGRFLTMFVNRLRVLGAHPPSSHFWGYTSGDEDHARDWRCRTEAQWCTYATRGLVVGISSRWESSSHLIQLADALEQTPSSHQDYEPFWGSGHPNLNPSFVTGILGAGGRPNRWNFLFEASDLKKFVQAKAKAKSVTVRSPGKTRCCVYDGYETHGVLAYFPNSFSYGVFANIGSGAVPGQLLGGRFREVPGRFRTTRSRKVPGQGSGTRFREGSEARRFRGKWFEAEFQGSVPGQPPVWFLNYFSIGVPTELEKDVHTDFLCLHCSPNAVGDNTWAYFFLSFWLRFIW